MVFIQFQNTSPLSPAMFFSFLEMQGQTDEDSFSHIFSSNWVADTDDYAN